MKALSALLLITSNHIDGNTILAGKPPPPAGLATFFLARTGGGGESRFKVCWGLQV